MVDERRNLYRILYVQPEAPQEVIKASYRALMSTLRAHPDLGGDHERAARLNAAYGVLGDPEARAVYDQKLRRPARQAKATDTPAPTASPAVDPAAWRADRRCPWCGHGFTGTFTAGQRCARCDSPLTPAPAAERHPGEIFGRRHGERVARDAQACVRLPGVQGDRLARLRDLSLSGLSITLDQRLPKGSALRVVTGSFDTVAQVVACRMAGPGFTVHARLLTLQLLRAGRGLHVDVKA